MTYDLKLAERVRAALAAHQGVTEINMFGGICFTLNGNMCCGVVRGDLVLRVGPRRYDEALAQAHARPMEFTGRPLRGFVFVGPGGYESDPALARWVELAMGFVSSLPARIARPRRARSRGSAVRPLS